MADQTQPFHPTIEEFLFWNFQFNNRWPTQSEWERVRKMKFPSTPAMKRYIRALPTGKKDGFDKIPRWVKRKLEKDLGANVAYLAIPEVAVLMFQATALGKEDTWLTSAIQNTSWWKKRVESQRAWAVAPEAEKQRSLERTAVWVSEQLISLYGRDYVKKQGWTLESEQVQKWARQVASGNVDQNVWIYRKREHAQAISGTPAQTDLLEDARKAGAGQVAIENTRGQLEQQWRQWMGDHLQAPDFNQWAEDVYANRKSMDDFNSFMEDQSASFYPTKPAHVPYTTWVEPARNILSRTLEIGNVRDDDPLLQSYVLGQFPSLADLAERARRDPRYRRTEQARQHTRNIGSGILSSWGY